MPTAKSAPMRAEATVGGAKVVVPDPEPFGRALWAPHAPLLLIVAIFAVLGIVWLTYAYVVVQLVRLRKGANP